MSRLFLYALLLALLAGPARSAQPAPIWPLDLPTRYLTSNFMEYRPGRFHAGLDLKTQTVTGFAARAVEDGWIVRVRATPTAYGRAVYLRGASGRTYVYAHLSRFNDKLRARLDRQRAQTGTYRARLSFKAGEMLVKQGEILGLTGQSGTGGPHLHFEVRDAQNRPTEPQGLGFAVGDTMAPVIYKLRVWPVSPGSIIQGEAGTHVLTAVDGLAGQQPPLRVTGPVAFSAKIVDHSDIRGHRLEPSLIELWLDGERVYRCHNEQFDFAENALERLEWVAAPGGREHWLYRDPADTLAGREGQLWPWGIKDRGLSAGRHQVRLLASDQAGNQAEIRFELVVDSGPGGEWSRESAAWLQDEVQVAFASADSLTYIKLTPFFEVMSDAGAAERLGLTRYYFSPDQGDPVLAPLILLSAAKPLSDSQRLAALGQGLTPLGEGREFQAATWPLAASLPVAMEAPAEPAAKNWGLCRWQNDHWQWGGAWPGGAEAAEAVQIKIDRPGLHAVMADTLAPVIELPTEVPQITRGDPSEFAGVTNPAWTILPVSLRDEGSGIAAETIKVRLDGEPLIVEPDFPRDRVLIEFPAEMALGRHKIAIEAADEVGQITRREFTIDAVR